MQISGKLAHLTIRGCPRPYVRTIIAPLCLLSATIGPACLAAQSSVAVAPAAGSNHPSQHAPDSSSRNSSSASPLRSLVATRAPRAPIIDGRDDDDVWKNAPATSAFREFDPVEDGDARFRTEFKVAYDNQNFYVFIRAFDPHPDSVRRILARRDVRAPSDQLKVMIDSYHDGRSGYEFAVNPGGVKRDYAMYNDNTEDITWDGVWDVATTIDSLGWTAEFAIPLSQLRFSNSATHSFGLGIWRDIDRFKERVSWPLYRQSTGGTSSQLGVVTGITDIGSAHPLELVPYVVTKNVSQASGDAYSRSQRVSFGGDLKYGVTSSLRLNATVNPDFGQVEADPAVLNLGAFETFFSEQRPFFVEGNGLYKFAINCNVVNCSSEGLFYSRRIGRSPHLLNAYGDASSPTATRILGAAKLSGRIGKGLSLGVLDAVTEKEGGSLGRTIEPATNYGVLRMQQEFRGGESGIGVVATGVNRALDTWTAPSLRRTANAGGIDFRHRFFDKQYQVSGSLTGTVVTGTPSAIEATQLSSVHYYQRPDGKLRVDSSLTSLKGDAEEILFGKYGGGITRFETSYQRQSPGYEINDLGYLRRADEQSWSTWASLQFRKPTHLYNNFQINGNQWNSWNSAGLALEHAVNTNMHMTLKNNWTLNTSASLTQLPGTYCDRCARGGPAVRQNPFISPSFSVFGDDRRRFTPGMYIGFGRGDAGRTHEITLEPSLTMRVSSQLDATLDFTASHNNDDAQWFGNFTDATPIPGSTVGATHYSFAHLDQKTYSTSLRLSYTATPQLSLQVYAQPFVSTGTYSRVRELGTDPRASDYDRRYVPYTPPPGASLDFSDREFRSNTVVRWEYRPGSTIFFVWTQGRQMFDNSYNDRGLTGNYRDLFGIRPDNTFLIKMSYWLNR